MHNKIFHSMILQTMKYRIDALTKFMDAHNSNYLTHGTSKHLKDFIV